MKNYSKNNERRVSAEKKTSKKRPSLEDIPWSI